MTMPKYMNCQHSPDGWCLECVKNIHDELAEAKACLQMGCENSGCSRERDKLRAENERLRNALQPFATGGHLHMTYGDYDSRTAVDEALKAEWHCPKCNGTSWARDYGKMEVRCLTCDPDPTLEFARPIAPNDQET